MSMAGAMLPASGLSALFSLSNAAAIAPPLSTSSNGKFSKKSVNNAPGNDGISTLHAAKHLGAPTVAGQRPRRRMSDAKDAVAKPASYSSASALVSLSSLSLAASPDQTVASSLHLHPLPHSHGHHTRTRSRTDTGKQTNDIHDMSKSLHSTSHIANGASNVNDEIDVDVVEDDFDDGMSVAGGADAGYEKRSDKKGTRMKKRGHIYKCESCSKVYRHPSCLIKHRWEHSPHWREASKFLLSKHQQVQLLEAATILSHLSPGSSLPEDRSLWPSFLSGGLLPPPSSANTLPAGFTTSTFASNGSRATPGAKSSAMNAIQPLSSSVPSHVHASSFKRSGSVSSSSGAGSGPRMHEYPIQGNITRIRPGLLVHANTKTNVNARTSVSPGMSVSPYAIDGTQEEGEHEGEHEREYGLHNDDGIEASRNDAFITVTSPIKPRPMNVPTPTMHLQDGATCNFASASWQADAMYSGSGELSVENGSMLAYAIASSLSLPRSDLRSSSVARSLSYSRSGSGSGSGSGAGDLEGSASRSDEDEDEEMLELELERSESDGEGRTEHNEDIGSDDAKRELANVDWDPHAMARAAYLRAQGRLFASWSKPEHANSASGDDEDEEMHKLERSESDAPRSFVARCQGRGSYATAAGVAAMKESEREYADEWMATDMDI